MRLKTSHGSLVRRVPLSRETMVMRVIVQRMRPVGGRRRMRRSVILVAARSKRPRTTNWTSRTRTIREKGRTGKMMSVLQSGLV